MPLRDVWSFLDRICCCWLVRRVNKKPGYTNALKRSVRKKLGLPFAKPFIKPNYTYALKRSMRKKLGLPFSKRNKKLEADPFLHLGHGIKAYLTLVW